MANLVESKRLFRERILMVEDHPLFVRALQDLVHEHYPALRVEAAPSCAAAASWLSGLAPADTPRVVLCDLDLPDARGAAVVEQLRPLSSCPLWVVSAESSQLVIDEVLARGANGFISKRTDALGLLASLKCVLGEPATSNPSGTQSKEVVAVRSGLSAGQQRVAEQLVLGLSNKQIAAVLFLSLETVKSHVSEIMAKVHASNRTQAVLKLLAGWSR